MDNGWKRLHKNRSQKSIQMRWFYVSSCLYPSRSCDRKTAEPTDRYPLEIHRLNDRSNLPSIIFIIPHTAHRSLEWPFLRFRLVVFMTETKCVPGYCSSLSHFWLYRKVLDLGQWSILFYLFKISSRLEPESKFMFFFFEFITPDSWHTGTRNWSHFSA